jgi:hydroxyacylglutathione hydrolase
VLDVRNPSEWSGGRIDSAQNIPLSRLRDRLDEIDPDRALVTYCGSGYRSAIAASLLQRAGSQHVADLVGGLTAWEAAELPTVAATGSP